MSAPSWNVYETDNGPGGMSWELEHYPLTEADWAAGHVERYVGYVVDARATLERIRTMA